ncbi:MAG: NAD-dependent epimerase/dehydratase family protein [Deltaproteobacteria bacterium]|nr:NAD-dependent epimerase/dehydratase family protein [Deltaproteobacteria bacterium]
MRVFVTGASGFIGGAVARALAAQHSVFAMSRSAGSDTVIEALGAQPLRCDLAGLRPGDLPEIDAVVHCAAWVEPWGTRSEYWEANVAGTDRLLAAARAAGARRFVHMSTEAVLWRGQHLRDVDETHPYAVETPYLYSETKAEAERRVLASSTDSFTTIALRPRFVWGPGDRTLAPQIKMMVEGGAFFWLDGGRARTSTTHVANLVHAVELALEGGRGGEAYFVTDGEVSDFRSFVPRMMAPYGVTLPERSLPGWLARPAAAVIEGIWRALRIRSQPPATRHAIDLMCCDCVVIDEKARRELGYAPVLSVEQGLEELARCMH